MPADQAKKNVCLLYMDIHLLLLSNIHNPYGSITCIRYKSIISAFPCLDLSSQDGAPLCYFRSKDITKNLSIFINNEKLMKGEEWSDEILRFEHLIEMAYRSVTVTYLKICARHYRGVDIPLRAVRCLIEPVTVRQL